MESNRRGRVMGSMQELLEVTGKAPAGEGGAPCLSLPRWFVCVRGPCCRRRDLGSALPQEQVDTDWRTGGPVGAQSLGASVGPRRGSLLRYVLGLCGGECV